MKMLNAFYVKCHDLSSNDKLTWQKASQWSILERRALTAATLNLGLDKNSRFMPILVPFNTKNKQTGQMGEGKAQFILGYKRVYSIGSTVR